MSCSRHAASNGLMPRSPLINRFSKWTAKLISRNMQFKRKSIYLARFNKPRPFTTSDIRRNSLSMVVERYNAFDGTVNYNVLDIDGTVESSNPPLYAPEAYPTDNERNDRTLKAE